MYAQAMRKQIGRATATPPCSDPPLENAAAVATQAEPDAVLVPTGRRKRKAASVQRTHEHRHNPTHTYSNTVSAKVREVLASLITQHSTADPVCTTLTSFVHSSGMADLVSEYMEHDDMQLNPSATVTERRAGAIAAFTEAYDAHLKSRACKAAGQS